MPDTSNPGEQPHPSITGPGSTLGLKALQRELLSQGVSTEVLLKDTGIPLNWFDTAEPLLTYAQRLRVMQRASHLAKREDTAIRAGLRQKISDLGLYGYAIATSATLRDALAFSMANMDQAGSVLQITHHLDGDNVVWRSQQPQSLGPLLKFAAEFWRSSMTTLFSEVIGKPFPSAAMYFCHPKPSYVDVYKEAFQCKLIFDSPIMEWHVPREILDNPCCNANEVTAKICSSFCEEILSQGKGNSILQREIRSLCLSSNGKFPTGEQAAEELGMSRRTLFRKLKEQGTSFQELQDEVRSSLAVNYLEFTRLSVEEIAFRLGFSDSSNFRKAFKRWKGVSPFSLRTALTNQHSAKNNINVD